MAGSETYYNRKTIETMKSMKVGQTILLASKNNDSLFIKIPMVQKEVDVVFNELAEPLPEKGE